ncbi:DUF3419 family protein [Fibrella sp. USSR17]
MMQSEFYTVALDRLRYSLVWEDSVTLYTALDVQPDDEVLVITSAGCNALNLLLADPQRVVAVDLNPVQNRLLRLKMHVIRHHDHAVFRGLLGFDGPDSVVNAFAELRTTLAADDLGYWRTFFDSHPEGILLAGKLEAYITGFLDTLDADTQQKLRQLVQFDHVGAQWAFFGDQLHGTSFQEQFIHYFDEANLSKGRDPRLFTYAEESGGEAFYNRLCRQIATTPVQHNFFFRFFFFGPSQLPEAILPPCYREAHYAQLRTNLHKLTSIDGEAVEYLLSEEGQVITKASMSNIFEYTSQEEFRRVGSLLTASSNRIPLRFVFWNLLQEQGAATDAWPNAQITDQSLTDTACFYFKSVRVMEPINTRFSAPDAV